MLPLNSIKKPTFYTFEFFSEAGKELLYRDEHLLKDEDRYAIIGWNWHDMRDNKPCPARSYVLQVPHWAGRRCWLKVVGGACANPLQTWSNLGKPRTLDRKQLQVLRAAAEPLSNRCQAV